MCSSCHSMSTRSADIIYTNRSLEEGRIWREGCGARLTEASSFRYRHKKGTKDKARCKELSAQGIRTVGAEEGIRAPHGVEIASGAVNPRGKLAFCRPLPNSKTTVGLCGTTFRFSKKVKSPSLGRLGRFPPQVRRSYLAYPGDAQHGCIPLSQDCRLCHGPVRFSGFPHLLQLEPGSRDVGGVVLGLGGLGALADLVVLHN